MLGSDFIENRFFDKKNDDLNNHQNNILAPLNQTPINNSLSGVSSSLNDQLNIQEVSFLNPIFKTFLCMAIS